MKKPIYLPKAVKKTMTTKIPIMSEESAPPLLEDYLANHSKEVQEWTILNWVSSVKGHRADDDQEMEESKPEGEEIENSNSEMQTRKEVEEKHQRDLINIFFDSLPKLESHYCRKDTSKLYFEPRWQTKAELFRLYESFCENQDKGTLKASICIFYGIFD
ncbi:hypothetical protein HHI36_008411 [Cryptolaemus montrouzieri]|uniref:Uncharacterized protein n=1 Tax=Cryptolaemus montrouzieri TaxID=559131 RepID=A0ABD2MSG1_9CUCU